MNKSSNQKDKFSENEKIFKEKYGTFLKDEADRFIQENAKSVDYSFLNKKCIRFRAEKRLKIAAVLVICLLLGSGLFHSHGNIRNLFQSLKPDTLAEDENWLYGNSYNLNKEKNADVFEITDLNDLDQANTFFTGLRFPQYLPGGFIFKKLQIEKDIDNSYMAQFLFTNQKNESLEILEWDENDPSVLADIYPDAERIERQNRSPIFLTKVDKIDNYTAFLYENGVMIRIQGDCTKKELVEIGKHFE